MERNDNNLLSIFRRVMHIAFCGRVRVNSKFPEDCPVLHLTSENWNKVKISDLIGFKEEKK